MDIYDTYDGKIKKYEYKLSNTTDPKKREIYSSKLKYYESHRGGRMFNYKCVEDYIYSPVTSKKITERIILDCIGISKKADAGIYIFGADDASAPKFITLNAQTLFNNCSKNYLLNLTGHIAPVIARAFITDFTSRVSRDSPIRLDVVRVLFGVDDVRGKSEKDLSDLLFNGLNNIFMGVSQYAELFNPDGYVYNFKHNRKYNLLQRNFNTDISYKKDKSTDLVNFLDISNVGSNVYNMEHITFTGGGAKGVIYAGTLLALMVTGNLPFLNRFTGTSAGALTACIFACLTPSKKEYTKIKSTTLASQSYEGYVKRYWLATIYIFKKLYNVDFSELFKATFLEDSTKTITRVVSSAITSSAIINPADGFIQWYKDTCSVVCTIMGNGLDKYINGPNGFFTFEEYFEQTGKTLVIVTSSLSNQKSAFNSHETTPTLPVITAVCASMAIPVIFPAVKIDDKYHVDGGFFSNYALDNNDFRELNGFVTEFDRKQYGQNLEYLSESPYEMIRTLLLFYARLQSIKNEFDTECKMLGVDCTLIKKSKIDVVIGTIEKYLDVTNFFTSVKETIGELKDIQKKDSVNSGNMGKIINMLESLYEDELRIFHKKMLEEDYKIKLRKLSDQDELDKGNLKDAYDKQLNELKTQSAETLYSSLPKSDLTNCLIYPIIEKNIQRYIKLDSVIEATKALATEIGVDEIIEEDDAIKSKKLDIIEFINTVYELRNSPNIIFQEYWRSTEYSENEKNVFFGIEEREGYKSGYELLIATYYGIIKSVGFAVRILDGSLRETRNSKLAEYMQRVSHYLSGIDSYTKGFFDRFNTVIDLSSDMMNFYKDFDTTLEFLRNPVKYIFRFMKQQHKLVMSATKIISDPIGYCIDTLSQKFGFNSKNLKVFGTIYTAATYIGASPGLAAITGFSIPLLFFFALSKAKQALKYFSNFSGLMDAYFNQVNDKTLHSEYNDLRTIRLNVFDAGTLEFNMSESKKNVLIYESFDKTTKFLAKLLLLQAKTGVYYQNDEPEFINNY